MLRLLVLLAVRVTGVVLDLPVINATLKLKVTPDVAVSGPVETTSTHFSSALTNSSPITPTTDTLPMTVRIRPSGSNRSRPSKWIVRGDAAAYEGAPSGIPLSIKPREDDGSMLPESTEAYAYCDVWLKDSCTTCVRDGDTYQCIVNSECNSPRSVDMCVRYKASICPERCARVSGICVVCDCAASNGLDDDCYLLENCAEPEASEFDVSCTKTLPDDLVGQW
eukprot:Blabericola_migrator_1__13132@NODE_899_length_6146_cov_140_321928_g629_i0_p4_GENE_NODE_899_length_6146_cov_140_321928_g629_i0NODE_899_length_6146_cov_140_321928_g629_i0_p4_ORF_typecomplete_len223_score11_40_NODE_899_length_6146_cov_140_321928_g629_i025643232